MNEAKARALIPVLLAMQEGAWIEAGGDGGHVLRRDRGAGRPRKVAADLVTALNKNALVVRLHDRLVLAPNGRTFLRGEALALMADESGDKPGSSGPAILRHVGAEPHEAEAARRFSHLAERAGARARVGQDWDGLATGRVDGGGALEGGRWNGARESLERTARALGPFVLSLLLDALVHDMSLRTIEQRRCWPQRTARIALKVALNALAGHYGLDEVSAKGVRRAVPLPAEFGQSST